MTPQRKVPLTRMEVPDYGLGLRGKLLRTEKTLNNSAVTFCTIQYGLSHVDSVTENSFSSAENGFPDTPMIFDEETRVSLSWQPGVEAVIADLADREGNDFPASPRGNLKRVVADYEKLGISPVLGYEFEFWIFHDEERSRPSGVTEGLGRQKNAYNLQRLSASHELITTFINRMDEVGIKVEAFHSELGPGLFEFTLGPEPAVRAADNAARAKQYMRELCQEYGLAASFMAKPFGNESGAGGHVHSSLVRDGKNIFSSMPGELSDTSSSYLAGLVETMADLTVLFAPYVNSYKRFDPEQWVADNASFGLDDRHASCRILLNTQSAARVEHRVPGADVSPYLSALGILVGGLHGIKNNLSLKDYENKREPLPRSLRAAIERFEDSEVAKSTLAPEFLEAFTNMLKAELNDYEAWLHYNITQWERERHLEQH